MKFNTNKILAEWAYCVDDGQPNVSNVDHVNHLREVLYNFGLPHKFIVEYVSSIQEIDFSNQAAFTAYDAKHKMRKTTKVNIAGKATTAGAASTATPAKTPEEKEKMSTELKKQISLNVESHMDPKIRIQNLAIQAEWDLDGKEEAKAIKALAHLAEKIDASTGNISERTSKLVALAWISPDRKNSGYGKNMQSKFQRDAVLKDPNKQRLLDVYDEAKPENVEKGVRAIRKRKVSEQEVIDSFNALPPDLQQKLGGKGRVGAKNKNNHFRGYIAIGEDGKEYTTSDFKDPNIQKDENGKSQVDRGSVPSKDRAILIWRIYLEQGGMDAYDGEPLQIQDMDLEHLVGFNNSDNGAPTLDDALNREHDANFVLTASSMNQTKKDMSMPDYIKHVQKNEADRDDEYYERMSSVFDEANATKSVTEERALASMDVIEYKIKGGGSILKTEYDKIPDESKPKLTRTDDGTPRTKSATLSPNIDQNAVELIFEQDEKIYAELKGTFLEDKSIDKDEKDDIKSIKSKIGKKHIQAMGLPGGAKDPSGRRTSKLGSTDGFYKGFVNQMASVPYEDRKLLKEVWRKAVRHIETDEVRGVEKQENPDFDSTKKEGPKNAKFKLVSVLNYPEGHKKAGKNRGKSNQAKEFRKFIRDAKYPAGHPKEGQPLFDIDKLPAKYQDSWRYKNDTGESV